MTDPFRLSLRRPKTEEVLLPCNRESTHQHFFKAQHIECYANVYLLWVQVAHKSTPQNTKILILFPHPRYSWTAQYVSLVWFNLFNGLVFCTNYKGFFCSGSQSSGVAQSTKSSPRRRVTWGVAVCQQPVLQSFFNCSGNLLSHLQ